MFFLFHRFALRKLNSQPAIGSGSQPMRPANASQHVSQSAGKPRPFRWANWLAGLIGWVLCPMAGWLSSWRKENLSKKYKKRKNRTRYHCENIVFAHIPLHFLHFVQLKKYKNIRKYNKTQCVYGDILFCLTLFYFVSVFPQDIPSASWTASQPSDLEASRWGQPMPASTWVSRLASHAPSA